MIAILQRVKEASVAVDDVCVAKCDKGFLLLLGVAEGDDRRDAELLADKIAKLRVFEDEAGKMNKSVTDIGGEILVVSQFTLCADIRKGNRPSFTDSAAPDEADRLYRFFCSKLLENGISKVETGVFAADMKVEIENDGPVTIVMDTDIWCKK